MFWEFVRAMKEVQPRWFLFENVASMSDEVKKIISDVLGCQPIFVDSKDFSAQSRGRYYWTNIPVDLIHFVKKKEHHTGCSKKYAVFLMRNLTGVSRIVVMTTPVAVTKVPFTSSVIPVPPRPTATIAILRGI